MIGYSNLSSLVYLIDFGISKSYIDENCDHVSFREKVPFVGNYLFASKNAFLEVEQSRRDDLISLCYLLTFFLNGVAPVWLCSNGKCLQERIKKIGTKK
jgi:hypothetical protein